MVTFNMQNVTGGKLVHNAAWIFAGQGMSVVCQAIYFIALARLLGALEYGIYAGAFSLVMLLSQYSTLGSSSVLMRYVSTDHGRYARYWGYALLTTIIAGSVITTLIIVTGPLIAHSYSGNMLAVIALTNCIFFRLSGLAAWVFQTFEQMRFTAIMNLLTNALRMVAAGVMLFTVTHATAVQWSVVSLFVSVAVAIYAVAVTNKRFGNPTFDLTMQYQCAGEGLSFAFTYSTTGVLNDIDKVMLGHYGMNVANGIYTAAYQAVNVCTMPLTSIQAAAFPRFFKRGETAGIGSTFQYAARIIRYTAPSCLVIAGAIYLFAPLFPRLVGHGFQESAAALRWLCLLPFFRSFHIAAGDALTGAGFQNLRLSMQLIAAAFNFLTNLYLIPHYGWYGAAWSSLATDGMLACLNLAMVYHIKRIQATKSLIV